MKLYKHHTVEGFIVESIVIFLFVLLIQVFFIIIDNYNCFNVHQSGSLYLEIRDVYENSPIDCVR